jgi:hypothetical protein
MAPRTGDRRSERVGRVAALLLLAIVSLVLLGWAARLVWVAHYSGVVSRVEIVKCFPGHEGGGCTGVWRPVGGADTTVHVMDSGTPGDTVDARVSGGTAYTDSSQPEILPLLLGCVCLGFLIVAARTLRRSATGSSEASDPQMPLGPQDFR